MLPRVQKSTHPDSPHCCNDLHPAVWSGNVEGPDILEQMLKIRDVMDVLQVRVRPAITFITFSVLCVFKTENMINRNKLQAE